MKQMNCLGLILLLVVGAALGQQVGDQRTGGYDSARTNLNSNFGPAVPPFAPASTLDLAGTTNASSLLAFSSLGSLVFLVGESTESSTDYRLYDAASGVVLWTSSFANSSGLSLNYTPAVANDVVILGGPATTTVKGVRVSTGVELWEDASVGASSGIDPVITNGLAVYGGTSGFRGVDPVMGPSPAFWTLAATTEAQAPISSFGIQTYVHDLPPIAGGGTAVLHALESTTGNPIWSAGGLLGSNNPNVIATESLVIVNDDQGLVTALNSSDGSQVWSRQAGLLSTTNPTALAYDRLYLFVDSSISSAGIIFGPNSSIIVLDPETGNPLWSVTEEGGGIDHAVIANNVIYYYHVATGRVRARDAFTGALIWSLHREGLRNLAAIDDSIILLFADQIEVFQALQVLFFAHVADGEGQSTLLAVTNRSDDLVNATLSFFDPAGDPLALEVDGFGLASSVDFTVAAGASTSIQTLGGDVAQRGWARILSDGPLSGSSIFQARDTEGVIGFEAGVSASVLRSRGNVFTEFLPDAMPARTINTALAIANPSDETATVQLVLVDSDGAEVESAERVLEPGEQIAEFISQFFPGQELNDVRGSVRVSSEIPFIITALRTLGGLQLSSYAVGQ